jgi:thioredoxin-like negative regulator of GroEL
VTMKPRMHRLAAEFNGHASVYLVDADRNQWTREFVHSFPTIVSFRSGKEISRNNGTVDYSVIKCNLQVELRRRSS